MGCVQFRLLLLRSSKVSPGIRGQFCHFLYFLRALLVLLCSFLSCQVDIFQKDLLLIPIHLEVHWSLVSVDIPRRTITYFDSQRTLNRRCPKVGKAPNNQDYRTTLGHRKWPACCFSCKLTSWPCAVQYAASIVKAHRTVICCHSKQTMFTTVYLI